MKIFLDTIDVDTIIEYAHLIDGVTTNPSLLAKSPYKSNEEFLRAIEGLVDSVSLEVVSSDLEGMVKEAEKLRRLSKEVVVKLPATPEGLKACSIISNEGIKVNMTLCFSITQAMFAAKVGAYYMSLFLGRLDDYGENGIQVITEIKEIYKNYNFSCQILAASIRSEEHVIQSARAGVDIATVPVPIFKKLIVHSLTDSGLKKFLQDWKNAKD